MEKNPQKNTIPPAVALKKIKKKPVLPTQYATTANLGKDAAMLWRKNHADFNFPLLDYQTLATESDVLLSLAADGKYHVIDKKNNTQNLAATNKAINEAALVLKKTITTEHARHKNKNEYLLAYGFIKKNNGRFIFPINNNERKDALTVLTNKLQEAGGIFATCDIGLQGWLGLQSAHELNWCNSTLIRSQRASTSKNVAQQHKKVHRMLYILFHYLGLAFIDKDVAKIRRSFGFLKESF